MSFIKSDYTKRFQVSARRNVWTEESAFRRMSAIVQKAISVCAANSVSTSTMFQRISLTYVKSKRKFLSCFQPNALYLVSMEANARALTSANVWMNSKAIIAKSQPHIQRRNIRHVAGHVNMELVNRIIHVSVRMAGTEGFVTNANHWLRDQYLPYYFSYQLDSLETISF